MTDHRALATWDYEGTSYSVSVQLEDGKPIGLAIEAVTSDKTRSAILPIDFGAAEWYAQVWSESKSAKHLTSSAERALALGERLGYG